GASRIRRLVAHAEFATTAGGRVGQSPPYFPHAHRRRASRPRAPSAPPSPPRGTGGCRARGGGAGTASERRLDSREHWHDVWPVSRCQMYATFSHADRSRPETSRG